MLVKGNNGVGRAFKVDIQYKNNVPLELIPNVDIHAWVIMHSKLVDS